MAKASCRCVLTHVVFAILLLIGAAPLPASTLGVQSENANAGVFAARIDVANDCGHDNHEIITGEIVGGEYIACSTLTSDADLTSGAASFTAGDRVTLREGFTVSGGTLTVEIDRALYPDAWVQDDTPDGETLYRARFYVDVTQLSPFSLYRFYHFLAFDGQGQPELRVGLKGDDGTFENRIFLEVFLDSGAVVSTEGTLEFAIAEGWHPIDVFWRAAAGNSDGLAYLCVDSPEPPVNCVELSNLDNDTGAIDFVRWGAVDVPSGEPGVLDFDDFVSGFFDDNFETGTTDAWSATSEP